MQVDLLKTYSQTRWYFTCMCRLRSCTVVGLSMILMAALLSPRISMAPSIFSLMVHSGRNFAYDTACDTFAIAMYSASAVLRATIDCFFAFGGIET